MTIMFEKDRGQSEVTSTTNDKIQINAKKEMMCI